MPKKFVVDQDDLLETEPTECCAMCGKDIFTPPFCEECDSDTEFDNNLEEDWDAFDASPHQTGKWVHGVDF